MQSDLFTLIKSMSRSEKGYFKKFAQKDNRQNIYVMLFDEIDAQKTYDENEIKKRFRNTKTAKNLYSVKNYLFNLILKSLSSYHSQRFGDSRLNIMLIELNVLFEKGLYKQFRALLKKAIELAERKDKGYYLALLFDKEMRFLVNEYYEGSTIDTFLELKKRVLIQLDRMRIDKQYELLYYEMFYILKSMGSVRSSRDLEVLNNFIRNPLLADEKIAENFNSKFHLYSILGHYYRVINDFNNWYKYRKVLLELVESDPAYIKESRTSYISVLNNYLNACVHIGRYRDFLTGFRKLKEFAKQFENKKEYIDVQTRLFLLMADLELNYLIRTSDIRKIRETVNNIETGFSKFAPNIVESRRIPLYNSIAYGLFIIRDFDKCITYINKILIVRDIEPEHQSFARIRNLVVHFEAGNYELVEHLVKSTKRYLIKSHRFYRFEKLVLEFMNKLLRTETEKDKKSLYEKLREELIKISGDPFEKGALEKFDIISWIDSKIQNRTFAEVLKET